MSAPQAPGQPNDPIGVSEIDAAKPPGRERIPPVPSRDEENVGADEALPTDEEEGSIAENPSREEIRHGDVKPPRSSEPE